MKVPPTTVVVALVVLVFCDQFVQFWVTGLIGDTTGDPFLDPLQYHIVVVFTGHRGTIDPQEDVVVWCSPGLVLLFEEVVSNTTQCFAVEDHNPEEIMKFLGTFPGHRDWVLCAQHSNWIAVAHIIHLSEIGCYL